MLECVTLSTNHLFEGNPLYEMHRLRYQSIIKRQNWDVPVIQDMEYDAYDNPAAHYLVKRDDSGQAIGCSRLYPTDRPYMLKDAFSYLVSKAEMPERADVWEGSRFCVAQHLLPEDRKLIIQEMVIGYLEFAQMHNIKSIIGVMYPIYWNNIFIKAGWDVEWLGDIHKSSEGHKIIAGNLKISKETLGAVREKTGIHYGVLDHGTLKKQQSKAA